MKNFITWFLCYIGNLALLIGIQYLLKIIEVTTTPFESKDLLVDLITSLIMSLGTFFFILERREKKQKEKNKQLA